MDIFHRIYRNFMGASNRDLDWINHLNTWQIFIDYIMNTIEINFLLLLIFL